MKKHLLLIAGLLCLFGQTMAQTEEAKDRINRIKRDTTYLYGEATMPSQDEAMTLAMDFLRSYIEQWITENRDTSKLRSIVVKDLIADCEQLSLMRGSMFRAFAYVRKADLYAVDAHAISINLDKPASPAAAPAPAPTPAVPAVSPGSDSPANPSAQQPEAAPLAPEPKPEVPEKSSESESENPAKQELHEQLCVELCKLKGVSELESLISNAPFIGYLYGEVGPATKPQILEKAILVIFKPGTKEIVALLGPKSPKRMNLVTKVEDSTVNYPRCGAIWVSSN